MSQILHIFRKDVRHYWPEILASLSVLAIYTWHNPDTWSPLRAFSFGFLEFIWGILPGLVPIAWCFLIVRDVQAENLVGDRQFWVTRPYDWYKLLAAKVLFIIVFVNLPLFIVDLILLQEAGFPPWSYIAGLLALQAIMTLLVFLPATTGATVTPSIGQFLLLVLALVLCMIGIGSLMQEVPNAGMSTGAFPAALIMILICCACLFVVAWQYARRRVWQSRVVLVGTLLAIIVILVATPYRELIAREYPLPENGQPALAQFSFDTEAPHSSEYERISPEQREADIQLPMRVFGIKGDLVAIKGIFVEIESSDGFRANSKWQSEFSLLQLNQDHFQANFGLDKKTFERIKSTPVNLRVSLALSGYRKEKERTVIATANEFTVPDVGKCAILRPETPFVQCRAALKNPVFFATIDPGALTCPPKIMKERPTSTVLSWEGDWGDDSGTVNPGISPIIPFTLYFWDQSVSQGPNSVSICPGTPITFWTPRRYENSRAEIEIDGIRPEDYLPRSVAKQ